MPLSFFPACLPIAQGSLPHSDPARAIQILESTMPHILSWPRLPCRDFREQGIVQSVRSFPGVVIDTEQESIYVEQAVAEQGLDQLALNYLRDETTTGILPSEDAAGMTELLYRLNVIQGYKGKALKGQIAGPISLGLRLTDERRRSLAYQPAMLEALAQHLALRVEWQESRLSARSDDIIICVEEPFLDAFNSPFCPIRWEQSLELLDRVFAGLKGCRGLATRGMVNWSRLLESAVELIILDSYEHSATLFDATDALAAFLERPGYIAWGIVPADEHMLAFETSAALSTRLFNIIDRLTARGLSRDALLQASLITTSDDLAFMSPEGAEQALQLCADVSAHMREFYGLI